MKTAVKMLTLLLLAVTFTTGAIAQQKGKKGMAKKTAEERSALWLEKIGSQLNLTAEQTPKVKEALLIREKARDAAKEKHKGDKDAVKQDMKTANRDFNVALRTNLTKEQQQKLREIHKTMKAEREKRKSEKAEGKKDQSSAANDIDELID